MHCSANLLQLCRGTENQKKTGNLLETGKLLGLKIKNKKTEEKRPEVVFILFCKHIQILG